MNMKEKIALSIFYKCYNEDAMVFVKQIKPYKVLSKFI
jgi:hypothetical protein